MKALIILLLAACNLNQVNTGLMVGANATVALDWEQTDRISRRPDLMEANTFLGERPSRALTAAYMGTWIAAITVSHWALPKLVQTFLYSSVILIEAQTIHNNVQVGGWL